MSYPPRFLLEDPDSFLRTVSSAQAAGSTLALDAVDVIELWSLVGLATLARKGLPAPLHLDTSGMRSATRFARALGIDSIIEGKPAVGPPEQGRTVKLTSIDRSGRRSPYQVAFDIAQLVIPDGDDETQSTIYYVLAELLRNVLQHSRDKLGGIAAAQLMSAGRGGYEQERVQIAVGDAGIGIPESLRHFHPNGDDPKAALVRALDPHVSGTFAAGLSGTEENAGLGLFFIAEMAKQTAGRLLIASNGARLILEGARPGQPQRLDVQDVGFTGTLVAFEIPDRGVASNHELLRRINELARERTPKRVTQHWIRYEEPPVGASKFLVSIAAEDTSAARTYSEQHLEPRLIRRESIALDFGTLSICTQSFLHALLYEALRLAWAKRVPIYVLNVKPAVRSSLDLLESYALGG